MQTHCAARAAVPARELKTSLEALPGANLCAISDGFGFGSIINRSRRRTSVPPRTAATRRRGVPRAAARLRACRRRRRRRSRTLPRRRPGEPDTRQSGQVLRAVLWFAGPSSLVCASRVYMCHRRVWPMDRVCAGTAAGYGRWCKHAALRMRMRCAPRHCFSGPSRSFAACSTALGEQTLQTHTQGREGGVRGISLPCSF